MNTQDLKKFVKKNGFATNGYKSEKMALLFIDLMKNISGKYFESSEIVKENGLFFPKVNSYNEHTGFPSFEMANEYTTNKLNWWGSNLVCLGITEENGRFFPSFNVWD